MNTKHRQSNVFHEYFSDYARLDLSKLFPTISFVKPFKQSAIEPFVEMMDYRFQKLGPYCDTNINWMIIQCYFMAQECLYESETSTVLETFLDAIDELKDSFLEDFHDLENRIEAEKFKKETLFQQIKADSQKQFSDLETPDHFSTVSLVAKFVPFDQIITDNLQGLRSTMKSLSQMERERKIKDIQLSRLTNWMVSEDFEQFETCYGDIVAHLNDGEQHVLPKRLAYHA